MNILAQKLLTKFSGLPKKTKDLAVFLAATFLISLFMSSVLHSLVPHEKYEEGDIATTTIRSPKDMILNLETTSIDHKPIYLEIKRNEVIVRAGDRIGSEQIYKLQAIHHRLNQLEAR